MKTFATVVVLSAIFAPVSRSEDDHIVIDRGGMLVQGEVQALLTGAVSLAILKDDVELLKRLRLMGWDPKKPLGQSKLIYDGCPSLHAAALKHSPKTVEWLITEVGIEKDKRGKNNELAISLVDGSDQDAKEVTLGRILNQKRRLVIHMDHRGQCHHNGVLIPFDKMLAAIRASDAVSDAQKKEPRDGEVIIKVPPGKKPTDPVFADRLKQLYTELGKKGWGGGNLQYWTKYQDEGVPPNGP